MGFIEQQPRAANFILSEANGQRSRENIVLAPTLTPLMAGQVLAVDDSGLHVPYEGAGTEDDPVTASGVLYAAVPASEQEQQAVKIARDAELSETQLIGLETSAIADLEAVGLIVRT